MSYYQPQPTKNRTAVWVGLAIVVVALLAIAAYSLGRDHGSATTADGRPAAPVSASPVISWSNVGGSPVPVSHTNGPRHAGGGRATGFSHDALGAALAAVNISFRLASEVGPQVYEATAREQCFGDVDGTLEQIRSSTSTASQESTTPSEFWYKVTGGDPTGDLVLISIAIKTPQSTAGGGYIGSDHTMRWVAGDWQMQVHPPRASIIPSVRGFTLLGRPNV
jgi:hypothetical protein